MDAEVARFASASNQLFDILLFEERPEAILDSLARILGETLTVDRSLIYDVSVARGEALCLSEWLNPARPALTPAGADYPVALFASGVALMHGGEDMLVSYAGDRHPAFVEDGSAELLHGRLLVESLLWCAFLRRADGFYLLAFNLVGGAHRWLPAEVAFVQSATRHVGMALLKIGMLRARARAEEALIANQRVESLGVLAGGIAHDFNNLMVGVISNAELVLRRLPPADPLRERVYGILSAGQRAAALAGQLLAYAGKGPPGVGPVSIGEVVERTATLVRASMPDVRPELSIPGDLPRITCNVAQLEQVVMNLLVNAAEASEGRPEPVVRVALVDLVVTVDDVDRYGPVRPTPGRHIALDVADDGAGMTPDTLARMFEPFFTTKFTGRGLGLSSVLGIVKHHHGGIRITSAPGQGTILRVLWPVADLADVDVPAPDPPHVAGGRGRLVLVVDDEPEVASAVAALLLEHDYACVIGHGGQHGIAEFIERGAAITCVVLDLTMPAPGGREVMRELREIRPDLPIVLISGYTSDDVRAELEHGRTRFVRKPFLGDELAKAIQDVLA